MKAGQTLSAKTMSGKGTQKPNHYIRKQVFFAVMQSISVSLTFMLRNAAERYGHKMKTVAFVPIKLNSQRLPHKNILPIGELPLCWYVPYMLGQVNDIDEVYVYCSDLTVKNYLPENVKVLQRDSKLDQNEIKGAEIYSSFINEVNADVYILAHTTSPFLQKQTLENALSKVLHEGYDSAFSAEKIQTFAWYKNKPINYTLEDVPRTQDMEPVYVETSGFYIFKKEIFTEYGRRIGFKPFIQEVSLKEAVDIDTKADYDYACLLYLMGEKDGNE